MPRVTGSCGSVPGSQYFGIEGQRPRFALAGADRVVGMHRKPVDARSIKTGNVDVGNNRPRQNTAKCLRQPNRLAADRGKIEMTVKTARRLVAIDDVEKLLLAGKGLKRCRKIVHQSTSVIASAWVTRIHTPRLDYAMDLLVRK